MKNKAQQARQLEEFLETELSKSLPITVLQDNSVVYKRYRIKQGKTGSYNLHFSGLDNKIIASFNLKVCALVAAKRHDKCQLTQFNEARELDAKYWASHTDAKYYQSRLKTVVDGVKYDILSSRLDLTQDRAKEYKKKILAMFRYSF
jgi:hypothetical protein